MSNESLAPPISGLRTDVDGVQLVGSECPTCERRVFPPRLSCPTCLETMDDWLVQSSPILETYSEIHVAAARFETPYLAGFVQIPPDGIRAFAPLVGRSSDFDVGSPLDPVVATVGDQQTWAFRPATEVE